MTVERLEYQVTKDGVLEFRHPGDQWVYLHNPEVTWAIAQAIDRDRANLKDPLPKEFKNGNGYTVLRIDSGRHIRTVMVDGIMPAIRPELAADLRDWLTEHIEAGTFGGES